MKQALKNITHQNQSSAKVVDGKLILSFPDAQTPIIWQMDLTQAKASALEVREHKEKDTTTFSLTLKNPKGENIEIARFEKRNHAVDGLMAASRALENAQGLIRPVTSENQDSAPQNTGPKKQNKWIGIILLILFAFVLLNTWGSIAQYKNQSLQNPGAESSPQGTTNGVPLSADDFLNQKQ